MTGVQLIEKDADAPDFYSFSWSSISGATRDKTRERIGKLLTQLPNPHPRNIRILIIKSLIEPQGVLPMLVRLLQQLAELTVLVEILVHGVFRKSKIPKNGDNSRNSKNQEHVVCATFPAVNHLEIL